MKINPHEQIDITEEAITQVMRDYGITPVSFFEVPDGISHTVVRIIDDSQNIFFLKFYKTSHKRENVLREINFTSQLRKKGLPIPEYVSTLSGAYFTEFASTKGVHSVTLTKFIAGQHPDTYTPKIVAELGALHGDIHNVSAAAELHQRFSPLDIYHFFDSKPGTQAHDIDAQMRPIVEAFTNSSLTLPSGIVPLDIKRDNVLAIQDHITGIIDFADTTIAPLIFCLAGPLWDILETQEGKTTARDSYVASYKQTRVLTSAEDALLIDAILTRGWITYHGSLLTSTDQSLIDSQAELIKQLLAQR